ncbi:MAG: YncE family protein, partial [Acidobacteriia bacterium]|nr:YncE family protein [Terriglobia bacterium]
PYGVAVNPVTNKIYVANHISNNVSVINGFTNGVTTVTDPNASSPAGIAVNPVTNKIYVANPGSNNVTVVDGATNSVTTVTDPNATDPYAVAVNPVTNKIYVANLVSTNVTVIDGATNTIKTVTDPNATHPDAIAVNPVTNEMYVANEGNNVTVIAESNVQPIPLQASITPQTNNEVTGASASFSFSASSSFSPTAPPPDGLYYQLDTWQGPWQPATSEGSNNFTGTVSGLAPGTHILYAYSTDGQDATSTNTGFQSSPLISNITAYVFLELPPTGTPSVVSASPNAASRAAQTFILTYSDTGGTDALRFVSVDFNSSLTAAHGCSVRYEQAYYNQANSALYLYNDAGTAVKGPLALGSSGTLANSQCTINGMGSSVTTDGNNLILNLSVMASGSFEGVKNIYMYAADNGPAITGWVNEGTWTPSAAFVPSIVSVSPNPATGASENFELEYADTGGYGALTSVAALFNSSLSSKNACYVYYVPQTNLLYLQNDNGQGATSITPGSGTLMNSQCTITGSSTTVVTSGNNLTLNLAVMASSSFEGPKNIYMYAADSSSTNTGWAKEGAWTPSAPFVPSIVSASPNPAVGPSQNFMLEYSDTGGYGALTSVAALFNSSLSSKNACYVYYVPQTNLLYLQNDNGQGATSITPGSGTLMNSQCTINGSMTTVVTSGNDLTLNLAVMGSVSFTGIQKIYMKAADDSGASSGWVDEGTWAP